MNKDEFVLALNMWLGRFKLMSDAYWEGRKPQSDNIEELKKYHKKKNTNRKNNTWFQYSNCYFPFRTIDN